MSKASSSKRRESLLKKREIDWSRGGKKKKKNLHSGASKEDGRRKKERTRAAVLSAGCPLEEEEGLGVIRPSRSLQKEKKSIDRYIFFWVIFLFSNFTFCCVIF